MRGWAIIEEVGSSVRDFKVGDRVVVPSTICCGHCSYCTSGYQSQCDNANPNGKQAGTAFFGGPKTTGPLNGLQAEFARVPLADPSLVKLPAEMTDDQAILLSDIFPTGYFGADMAEIKLVERPTPRLGARRAPRPGSCSRHSNGWPPGPASDEPPRLRRLGRAAHAPGFASRPYGAPATRWSLTPSSSGP